MQTIFLSLFLFFACSAIGFADGADPAQARQIPQVSQDYRIVPGDVLDISVWKEEGLNSKALVRPDGGISIPLAGNLQVEGLTTEQLKKEIAKRLTEYLSDPEVTVAVINTNQKVYVMGKVNKPGELPLARAITVTQALAMAGGLAPFADEDDIKILRRVGGQTISMPFDYGSVSKGEDLEQNIELLNGDVVVVP
ncbi:MAG: polysaccharide biosynthesis/export family protein [Candidatus Methylumidiphilus sp.]